LGERERKRLTELESEIGVVFLRDLELIFEWIRE